MAVPNLPTPPPIEVTQTSLDNGLTVVIQQDPSTVLAAVNLWYAVGSRDERPDRTGFAHLFEHLMFQGSAHVAANEHFSLLEKVGATLNATTSVDRTNYFQTLPVEHLDLALWLEADRMGSLDVSQPNLDNQREVVKEEKRQRVDNQPTGTFFADVLAALFPPSHPYGHAPIGSMEHLDAADLDDVRTFHRTWYGPNAAVLTVVSPLAVDDVLARVRRYFGGIGSIDTPPATPDSTVAGWQLPTPVRVTIADRVNTPVLGGGWRIPPYGHPGHVATVLALGVLGHGRGSRLARSLTRDRELVAPTSRYFQSMDWDGGVSLAVTRLQCRPGVDPAQVADVLGEEVERLAGEDPSADELDRAKALAATAWMQSVASPGSRADNLSRVATKTGRAHALNREIRDLLAVTPVDVRTAADACLSSVGNALITYVPAGAGHMEESAA